MQPHLEIVYIIKVVSEITEAKRDFLTSVAANNFTGKLFKTPCASVSPLALWGIIKCKLSLTVLGGLKELIWGVLRMVWHIVNVFGFSLLHPL